MTEVAKISTKGQIVIPQDLRDELGLTAGTAMAVERVDDCLILKKVALPDLAAEFKRLSALGAKLAKRAGIRSEDDVVRLVREVRTERAANARRKRSK